MVGRSIEEIAVRAGRRNGFDRLKGLGVEEGRGIAGDEAGMVFRVDRDAMPGGIGQGAGELVGIEVEHTDRIAASDIDPAVDAVGRDVVDPTGGGNLRGGENFIGLRREVGGGSDWREV